MTEPIPARRDADLTGSCVVGAVVCVPLAWGLWRGGHPVWAVIVALFAAWLPFLMRNAWEAKCPSCSAWMKINFGDGKYARCKSCARNGYYRFSEGCFTPVPPGETASWMDFEVYLWDLAPDGRLELPFDGGCCVCRKPVHKGTMVRLAASEGGVPGVYQNIRSTELEIPHCPEHGSGVGSRGGGIGFASYDYWREFLRLNGR